MKPLTQQLADFQAGAAKRFVPERLATMERATTQLRASGIEETALKVGALLPDLSLPDANGHPVSLRKLNREGPLAIVFYRGGWCPYCNLELREWQRLLPELRQARAQLVAISPQSPDNSLSTVEKNELAFPVLSDSALAAANAFGVAFNMPAELIDLYTRNGNDLPTVNANGQWVLPIPATYLVGADGHVVYAHVEADYRQRAEPVEVLRLLQKPVAKAAVALPG